MCIRFVLALLRSLTLCVPNMVVSIGFPLVDLSDTTENIVNIMCLPVQVLGIAFALLVNVIPVVKCDTPFSYIDSHDLDLGNPVITDLFSTACQHVPHASSDNPLDVILAV